MSFTPPKQSQRSRPVLFDGSRFFGSVLEGKNCFITEEIWYDPSLEPPWGSNSNEGHNNIYYNMCFHREFHTGEFRRNVN